LACSRTRRGIRYRLQCEQQVYCELLEAHLAGLGGVCSLRRGVAFAGVRQSASAIVVEAREPDEATVELEATWLIGADGARSAVREAVGLHLEGSTYPETTILATTTFPFEQHLEGLSNVNYCWSPHGTFSLLRLPHLWRVSLYADAEESMAQALRRESIEVKLQRIVPTGRLHDVLEARPTASTVALRRRTARAECCSRADAAHLNSPSGGMGMNGGLHDAFNLCDKLARVCTGRPTRCWTCTCASAARWRRNRSSPRRTRTGRACRSANPGNA